MSDDEALKLEALKLVVVLATSANYGAFSFPTLIDDANKFYTFLKDVKK